MKVLVASGSSGGHLFPALSLLERIKKGPRPVEALLVLPAAARPYYWEKQAGCQVKYSCVIPFGKIFSLKFISAVFIFIKGCWQSLRILADFKPDLAVGFGGIASVPLLIAGRVCGVRFIIHEQNVLPGKANKLLAFFSSAIALAFAQGERYFGGIRRKKIFFSGMPLRERIVRIEKSRARDFFGLSGDRPVALVMGGSQSSRSVNEGFLRAALTIPDKAGLAVIHLAGKNDRQRLEAAYSEAGIRARVFDFLEEMEYAYSAADLAVSRSGALAVSEIAFFHLPAVFIPYPYAHRHQLYNARVLADKGMALTIEDSQLSSGVLAQMINDLLRQPEILERMRRSYYGYIPEDAAGILTEKVYSLSDA